MRSAVTRRLAAALACASSIGMQANFASALPVLDGTLTPQQWNTLRANPELARCQDESCSTLKALLDSLRILDQRDLPNTMARSKASREAAQHHTILPIPLSAASPDAASKACEFLTLIVSRSGDSAAALHSLEIASLLTPHAPACAKQVAAAAPADLDGITLLPEAHDNCLARREPACAALRR